MQRIGSLTDGLANWLICKIFSDDIQSQKRDGFQYPEPRLCPENHPRGEADSTLAALGPDMSALSSDWDSGGDRADRHGDRGGGETHSSVFSHDSHSYDAGDIYNTPSTTVEVSCSKKGGTARLLNAITVNHDDDCCMNKWML